MNKRRKQRLRKKIERTITTTYVLMFAMIITLIATLIIIFFQSINKQEITVIHVEKAYFENPMKPKELKPQEVRKEEKTEYCEKTEQIEENLQVNPEELELLAQVMYSEEEEFINKPDGEYVFKLAGSVIINRKQTHYRGANTIQEVIYMQGQYAETTKEKMGRKDIPEIVYAWAEELLTNGPLFENQLIYQSESEQGKQVVEHIGNQYFCLK